MGWGRDETVEASDATAAQLRTAKDAGALERAALPAEGGLSGAATRLVERLLGVGIDGKGPFASANKVAAAALANARGNRDLALRTIARDHRRLGALGGFATGLGGFFTMPIS